MTSPNPTWKPGDKIASPVEGMKEFNPDSISPKEIYRMMVGLIVPRPIAFISTIDAAGVINLAPFSFFNGVSSNPPCIAVSITRKPNGEKKDTLRNIEETGEFVVNGAHEWLSEALAHTAAAYPYGTSEMEKVGLTSIPSTSVRPSRVRESAYHLECKLHQFVEVGDGSPGSAVLVIGRIVLMHIADAVLENNRVSTEALKPISRLGGIAYGRVDGIFEIPTPSPES